MKKSLSLVLMLLLALSLIFAGCAAEAPVEEPAEEPVEEVAAPENPVIRLSTTTSVNDSGLLPYLQPYFEAATGYTLEITSAGTGAAIEKARTGDADCLLVHSKSQEEAFIGEGFNEERVSFMYNYFVVVGPEADPAGVSATASAADAFAAIAASGSPFISRGDASGTHTKELGIWVTAGLLESADRDADGNYPLIEADWYQSVGQGMGATLNIADEQQAYTLSDKATFLAHDDSLSILLEQADDMKNTYSMIAVSTDRFADVNYDGALAFIEWMTSEEAAELIAAYGVAEYGEALFYNL
ncbi:MAG: substrate-binding domain-containing protein [Bacillota bacterium]|nr:substrate-binding domain-containing protein [Bacillota bacterium]